MSEAQPKFCKDKEIIRQFRLFKYPKYSTGEITKNDHVVDAVYFFITNWQRGINERREGERDDSC